MVHPYSETNNKWADFAAFGTAWRISNEKFLKDFKPLNSLKLNYYGGKMVIRVFRPYETLSSVSMELMELIYPICVMNSQMLREELITVYSRAHWVTLILDGKKPNHGTPDLNRNG